jgi:hypothetical protein
MIRTAIARTDSITAEVLSPISNPSDEVSGESLHFISFAQQKLVFHAEFI